MLALMPPSKSESGCELYPPRQVAQITLGRSR
jgi:hypothetical protein